MEKLQSILVWEFNEDKKEQNNDLHIRPDMQMFLLLY